MGAFRKRERRKIQSGGELDWCAYKSAAALQNRFLEVILKVEPKLKRGLLGFIFKVNTVRDEEVISNQVRRWLKRYHLTDEWCVSAFQKSIISNAPMAMGYDIFSPRGRAAVPVEIIQPVVASIEMPIVQGPRLLIESLTWNPAAMPRRDMEARYQRYLDRVEEAYRQVGFSPPPIYREEAQLCWLAGYQVCGWSKLRIARAIKQDRAPVIRAIALRAKQIGLTLRSSDLGNEVWEIDKIRDVLESVLPKKPPNRGSG